MGSPDLSEASIHYLKTHSGFAKMLGVQLTKEEPTELVGHSDPAQEYAQQHPDSPLTRYMREHPKSQ